VAPPAAFLAFVRDKRREFFLMNGGICAAAVAGATAMAAVRGHADYITVASIIKYNVIGSGFGLLVSYFA
jgi:hypothetical protein